MPYCMRQQGRAEQEALGAFLTAAEQANRPDLADDVPAAKKFYDAALGALGISEGAFDEWGRVVYATDTGRFLITKPINGEPASYANGGTIGFKCNSPEQVRAFHDTAIAHGGKSIEEPPGLRDGSLGPLYLAYVRDPDGNKLCAIYRVK